MSMQMQTMRMHQQRQQMRRGGLYGYGGYGAGGMSPVIPYRMMQWGDYQIRVDRETFEHIPITPVMLQAGRGQLRARRHRTAAALLLAAAALWLLLWGLAPVFDAVVTLAALLLATAGAAWQGRHPTRRRPPVPRLRFIPAAAPGEGLNADADPEPFAIREAGRSPREAREAVRLALKAHKAPIGDVGVPEATTWGWRVPLVLKNGTLEQLSASFPTVATTLRVGRGRLLAQVPDPEDSAAVTLRVLTSDPFVAAATAPYPVRAPRSSSILDRVSLGGSIDGGETEVLLAGQHVIITAVSGGGKSSMVRRLAEFVTSCVDAVAIDIDPTGRGLGALRPCAAHTAYSAQAAERLLESLLTRAERRVSLLPDLRDDWEPTPQAPAIVVFLDEYRLLSKRAKDMTIKLLTYSRKTKISLVLSTTDATADAMGDAIAEAFGVRVLMPCRSADVPVVTGIPGAIGQGWLPHLLVPSPSEEEPADAGQFYCRTPRHREPILRYVPRLHPVRAADVARERIAAGLCVLPDVDPTPAAAGPDTAPAGAAGAGDEATVPQIAQRLLDAFAAAGDPEWLTLTQIADHLATVDPATWARWDGRRDRLAMVGRTLNAELRSAGLTIPRARLDSTLDPERPMACKLADVRAALGR
ncbi:hypothetical protein AOB60_43060 [Streptomyces noursei]|uniref:AAA+ ATPase domain-containing protein n=2 Tax=Streptomyces noursei TaxID=1971 RepID=A0A2N8P422_STRNR|nr:hypothetical protein AOB60_43060 [Streptomyces noursei]